MLEKISSVRMLSLLLILGLFSQVAGFTSIGISTVSASGDAFVVRYCTHDNFTGDPPYLNDRYLFIYSNGTATYQFISNNQWGNSTTNWTGQLSAALISELYETLIGEEFNSLSNSYDDLGWSQTWMNHIERACIEVSGELKTVTFNGRSMMGIVPGSYALLNNIRNLVVEGLSDLPNATLDIVVTELSNRGPTAMITANFTNMGDTILHDSGLCNISWPTYIVSVNGSTAGDLQDGAIPYCYMEFDPQTTRDFGPWEWNRTSLSPGKYVIMSRVVIWDYEIGNIALNSTWTPIDNHTEPNDSDESFSLALAGLSIAIAVCVATLYVIRMHQKGRGGRK